MSLKPIKQSSATIKEQNEYREDLKRKQKLDREKKSLMWKTIKWKLSSGLPLTQEEKKWLADHLVL